MNENEVMILILGFMGFILCGFIITKNPSNLLLIGFIGLVITATILYLISQNKLAGKELK